MNATVSLGISVLIFLLIIRGQFRGMSTPIKKPGISLLLPILYISTSLFQLMDPNLHLQSGQVLIALLIGLVISVPLIMTTNFEVRENGAAFIKRNKIVFVILIVVFALRFVFVGTVKVIDPSTLGFLCNLVTFGYVACWRIVSFIKFRNVLKFA
ncbi:CcdC protein domain-containing protein [Paenibacillus tyrfis]|uniref:CcdC protein domain-containing protein n=1 Tax=Paenibacillus tyrfis TaxID=1501230 RepID=UPI000B58EB26|nr:CcdC protein domain-containing protein [Paenibacillus tyrfis]